MPIVFLSSRMAPSFYSRGCLVLMSFSYSIVFQLCHFGYQPGLHLNSML